MKTAGKRIVSVILCISMLLGMIVVGDFYNDRAYADTASSLTTTKNEQIFVTEEKYYENHQFTKNKEADLGEETNPFVVLEVVPTLDQAQFGYFIPGCEPIDMDALGDQYGSTFGNMNLFNTYDINSPIKKTYDPVFFEDIPENSSFPVYATINDGQEMIDDYEGRADLKVTTKPSYWNGPISCWYETDSDKEDGCFYYVGENQGSFIREVKSSSDKRNHLNQSYVSTASGDGSYYFKYVGANQGNYNWLSETVATVEYGLTKNDNSNSDKAVWLTRKKFKCDVYRFYNKDEFIKAIFKQSSYGEHPFVSKVITITPEWLGKNLDLIDVADLIYFHTSLNTAATRTSLWKDYRKDAANRGKDLGEIEYFDKHDLTNDTVISIMKRMATDNPSALIFEGPKCVPDVAEGTYGYNGARKYVLNISKLVLMVSQFEPSKFVNQLGLLQTIEDNKSKNETTLYFPVKQRDSDGNLIYDENGNTMDDPTRSIVWESSNKYQPKKEGTFSFDASGTKELLGYMRHSGQNLTNTNVFEKIFIYNGGNDMLQNFLKTEDNTKVKYNPKSDPMNGGESLEDLHEHYGDDKTSYTIKEIMKYILSIPQYTPQLRVLELQPCQKFIYGSDENEKFPVKVNGEDKEYNWVQYYENLFPWYDSEQDSGNWVKDPERLKVTTMTTAEFIGNIGRYDYGQVDELNNPVTLNVDSSDDLIAKYDLIIIGSMQDASNGLNGYNDENLGNLIYTSVGDLVFRFSTKSEAESNGTSTNKESYVFDYQDENGVWKQNVNGSSEDKEFRSDYQKYQMRYSGNDITLKKMYEMEDFLKAGKPIVVDQNLYTQDGSKIDTTKVDQNSKLYDLLTWNGKNSDNILQYNSYTAKQMKNIVARSRCQLVFSSSADGYPLEYDYSEKDVELETVSDKTISGVIAHENYQPKDASGNAVLNYHFYINGVVGQKYEVHLCLDSDGDGVYRGSLKEHSEIDNMNVALGKKDSYDSVEKPLSMRIYEDDGTEVKNGELVANRMYNASYTLPKSRLGMVPWKLEVNNVQNAYLRSSAIDYTAFKKTNEAAKIKVLQMCLPPMRNSSRNGVSKKPYQDKNAIYNNSLWGNDDRFDAFTRWAVDFSAYDYYNPDYNYTLNSKDITDDIINKGGAKNGRKETVEKFEKYLGAVEEFDVSIQLLKNSDWYTYFGDSAKDDKGNSLKDDQETRLENWKTFLSEYDMIVLGFIDSNSFSEDPVFVGGIEDFINQGKSMIFSHDLVQSADAYNEGNYGDYSSWLRTISGQRRAYYNKQEDGTYKKSYSNTWLNGEEIFKQQDFTSYFNSVQGNDYSGMFFHKFTDEKQDTLNKANDGIFDSDYESVEKEFLNTYTCEVSDNAAQMYARFKSSNKSSSAKTDRIPSSGKTNITKGKSWPDNNSGTSFVRLANNGQITCYPYQLDDVIQVLNTHVQNYQLDLEYETMGDVNVWFNLTDTYDPDIKDNATLKSASTSLNNTDVYSSKMQDSRNSFYIYNKGNITYTGSGHGDAKGKDAQGNDNPNALMTDDEVKLFVNTMISAYRPPEEGPYVSIDNANSVSDNGDALIYVDYDTVKDASDADVADSTVLDESIVTVGGEKMVKVAFTLRDDEATDESQIYTDSDLEERKWLLNIKDHNGNDLVLSDANTIYQDSKSVNLAANGKTSKFYIAYPNKQYVIYVPYEDVKNGGNLCYQFTAYRTYVKEKRKCRTSQEITNLNVMILPLFNLN